MELFILLGIFILVFMALKHCFQAGRNQPGPFLTSNQEQPAEISGYNRLEEKDKFLDKILNGSFKLPIYSDVILRTGETCIVEIPEVSLFEERAVRRSGKSSGVSLRLARGLWIRTGGFESKSEYEITEIDIGTLTLTSKRVLFNGHSKTLEYSLLKVNFLESDGQTLAIGRSGKQKKEYFVGVNSLTITQTFTPDANDNFESFEFIHRLEADDVKNLLLKTIAKIS